MIIAKEKQIQRDIILYLKGLGAWVFKVHGSPYQQVGVPDLLIGYQGKFYAMEIKQPGKPLSPAQAKTIEEIRASGSIAGRVESIEDAIKLLEE